jgi:hypothetical protein
MPACRYRQSLELLHAPTLDEQRNELKDTGVTQLFGGPEDRLRHNVRGDLFFEALSETLGQTRHIAAIVAVDR